MRAGQPFSRARPELVLGQTAGFLAMGAILQPQQLGDLIQAEAQPLG